MVLRKIKTASDERDRLKEKQRTDNQAILFIRVTSFTKGFVENLSVEFESLIARFDNTEIIPVRQWMNPAPVRDFGSHDVNHSGQTA